MPANMPRRVLKDFIMDGEVPPGEHHELEQFMKDLNSQLAKAFPGEGKPYNKVQVLLLSWEKADSDNERDVDLFSEFLRNDFNFDTTRYKIEGTDACPGYKPLNKYMAGLIEASDANTLTIIYYSGHGYSNLRSKDSEPIVPVELILFPSQEEPKKLEINPDRDNFGPHYDFISGSMSGVDGSVLHLLECCSGGGAAISLNKDQECLAAATSTGSSAKRRVGASPPGYFTEALMLGMSELKRKEGSFTTVQLTGWMERYGRGQSDLATQPVFIPQGGNKRCITLTPLTDSIPSSLKPLLDAKNQHFDKSRKALIIVRFMEDSEVVAKGVTQWLNGSDRPRFIDDIRMIGFYPGKSCQVTFEIPFEAWLEMDYHPAIETLTFVDRGNLLLSSAGRTKLGLDDSIVDGAMSPSLQPHTLRPGAHALLDRPKSLSENFSNLAWEMGSREGQRAFKSGSEKKVSFSHLQAGIGAAGPRGEHYRREPIETPS